MKGWWQTLGAIEMITILSNNFLSNSIMMNKMIILEINVDTGIPYEKKFK